MLAALEVDAVIFHPLLEPCRPGEDANSFTLAQAVTGLGANDPGIAIKAVLQDSRRRHPQLIDLDAIVVLVGFRVPEPEETRRSPCSGHHRDA